MPATVINPVHELLAREFKPTPHPFLPWDLTPAEMHALLTQDQDAALELVAAFEDREKRIKQAEDIDAGDPYRYGFELPHWKDADRLLLENRLLYVGGGKRSSKSEWAAKRTVQAAMTYSRGVLWCHQGNETTSIATQQKLIWKYLPAEIKALNFKRDPRHVFNVNYSPKNGFADGKLVLPNKTILHFLTYERKVANYQGWQIGSPDFARRQVDGVPNIGAWPDEDMTMEWLNTIAMRLTDWDARMVWTFSPLKGITPAVKEFRGRPRLIASRPASLLPERVNVEGCPAGEMPYIEMPPQPERAIIYFHAAANPFGGCWEGVERNCQGKSTRYVACNAYGFAEDSVARPLHRFGPENIIKRSQLPARGTNYHFVDPHSLRNWAQLWVRVTPDDPPLFYIYRDWPDQRRHGEWATPTERAVNDETRRGWDGDPGPAQDPLGLSIEGYKRLFAEEEAVRVVIRNGAVTEEDPQRRRLIEKALGQLEGVTAEQAAKCPEIREPIHERFMDPRFGHGALIAQTDGGTCLQEQIALDTVAPRTGEVLLPGVDFSLWPATHSVSGEGLELLQQLLEWDPDQPLVPRLNAPRLYVCDECEQVIWAMENYTGRAGAAGACKDFIDLAAGMARADLQHIEPAAWVSTGGWAY